jgi:predicted RNA-binding protein with PIN domain
MAQHYLIDAYNVIHKSALLRPTARYDLERARDMLLDMVQCFCLSGEYEVTVVFDGRDSEQTREVVPLNGKARGMHLIYSPHHTTADTVIERLIYQRRDRMNCIVVSNDRSLRSQCRGMGSLTMEADSFLSSVRQVEKSAKETLQKRRNEQAMLLEDQLSPDTLRTLGALRDKLASGKQAGGKANPQSSRRK